MSVRFLVALGILIVCAAAVAATATVAAAGAPPQEKTRRAKIALLKRLPAAPDLVFLGGSRAQRLSPTAYQRITGKTAFNAALSSCSLADVYCLTRLISDTFPGTTQQYVWILNIEQFRRSRVPKPVFAQAELATYVPRSLKSPYGSRKLRTAGAPPKMPKRPWGKVDVYTDRGRLRWNRYDYWRQRWRTLRKGLQYSRWKYVRTYPGGYRTVRGLPKWFLKATIRHMNRRGSAPVIVLAPYHPSLLRLIERRGFSQRMREVKAYLRVLEKKGYEFVLLDMTHISSFRGWQSGFYDGVHMRTSLSAALLRKVISATGQRLR